MSNPLFQRHIVSIRDLSRDDLLFILTLAKQFKQTTPSHSLAEKIIATCFYEPSTRTRLSFSAAALRLGGQIIGFDDPSSTSNQKGESLSDSIKVISQYCDLIVLRHPENGAAQIASEASDKPVINAGDGSNQHPTQTLTDLMTIEECQGRLTDLNIAVVGDLKHGRTAHSLVQAGALFNHRYFFVSPESLSMPESIRDELQTQGIQFSCHQNLEEVIDQADIIYMTRFQQERLEETEHQTTSHGYRLTPEQLASAKNTLRVLHPLPRVDEIDTRVDDTPFAYYIQQAANGLFVREALLSAILNAEVPHE